MKNQPNLIEKSDRCPSVLFLKVLFFQYQLQRHNRGFDPRGFCVTKEEGGVKILENRVTHYMDDPFLEIRGV
jgi:hypothetical protein